MAKKQNSNTLSSKHPASSAASALAVLAPTLSAEPSEIEKKEWRKAAALDTAALLIDGDKALMRLTSMGVIDFKLCGGPDSNDYYDDRLKELGLHNAGDKLMMRAATAVSGLDRRDIANGEKAAKLLDSLATSMEGLFIHLQGVPGFEYAYSAGCVDQLIKIILEKRGLRALANLARNEVIDQREKGVISLDRAKAAAIASSKVIERFRNVSASTFSLATTDAEGNLIGIPDLRLDLEAVGRAIAGSDILNGRPQALHEMQFATKAIAREPTDKVKVVGSDPKDKKTEKRFTEPHIVACPGGDVIVSGHFAEASNVVRISDLAGIIDDYPEFHVMLPPEVHNKLGQNLAKVEQRNAVTITDEAAAAGTSQIYRTLKMRSDAAINPRYQSDGEGLSFSWRIPTYHKHGPEDVVPAVRSDREWSEEGRTFELAGSEGFANGIIGSRSRLDRAASQRKGVELTLARGTLTVTISKDSSISCRAASAAELKGVVRVSAADLRGLLILLEELKPQKVDLAVDADAAALRWSFKSSRAAYQLFMPCTGDSGTRLKTAFEPLKIVLPSKEVTTTRS